MRSRRLFLVRVALLGSLLTGMISPALAAPAAAGHSSVSSEALPEIPPALAAWRGWVLKGEEFRRCPFLAASDPGSAAGHRCAWPGRLELSVDASGGRFAQHWKVYYESWVALPGDLEHWPQSVQLDGRPAPLVNRNGTPSVRLGSGDHEVSGSWSWSVRPAMLEIPPETALLALTVNGTLIAQPERPDGRVVLGAQRSSIEPRKLEIQIYRLLQDEEPVFLHTTVRIRAAGDAREETLGRVLPANFLPLRLESDLPARLDADGTLRVQVRPGFFELTLVARQASPGNTYGAPSSGSPVHQEIWSFEANDRLRVAMLEGAPGIDPSQAQVPDDWRGFPAFLLQAGAQLRLIERSRGISAADQNRLQLRRALWLDFDHEGWTVRDELSGVLRRDWRLDMHTPYRLQSASTDDTSLLVTHGADTASSGVELRNPHLQLTALSRIAQPFARLPATGWTESIDSVSGEVFLPPGHRLIAVVGADQSPTAWIDRWGLWNLFGVLVVSVFARWVAGWRIALIGAVALLLTYQAEPGLIWGWGNLLVAVALARAAPAGRLAAAARVYRNLSFLVVAIALVPFAWTEVRHSIYPQLEVSAASAALFSPAAPAPIAATISAEQAPKQARLELRAGTNRPAALARQSVQGSAFANQEVVVTGSRRAEPLEAYAPGTQVQAGPGVPHWDYGAHPFGWSGPVEPDQTVRFIVLGPIGVALWRIGGIVLLVLFLLALARESFGRTGPWPDLRAAAGPVLVLIALTLGAMPPVHAQSLPTPELLHDLRARLTEPPRCVPHCAELLSARIRISGDRIETELEASALTGLAVALPSAGERWRIEAVTADDRPALTVRRENDGALWVPLEPGVHHVRITAQLSSQSIHLAFPMPPRHVSVEAPDWSAAGVSAGRLLSGAVDLTRRKQAAGGAVGIAAEGQEFPPFVGVTREFRLGLNWSIATQVERMAPSQAAFSLPIPLVPGESVLTPGVQVREGAALVGLAAGQDRTGWNSSLPRARELTLHLPPTPPRAEVWRFVVSPQWRVQFSGLPAVQPEDTEATPWVFEYRPRSGETLALSVTEPQAVPGSALAIEGVQQSITLGRRSSEQSLELAYRSTQGGRQTLTLPTDASVTRITVDGQAVALRPEDGQLALSILPGEHHVNIDWRSAQSARFAARPAAVDLHAPASNIATRVELSADRWPLFASGAGVGPAFLYWGELLVFIVVAVLLGRTRSSPLATSEWLLLGLGLSMLSWGVLVLVAAWLYAMRWRERAGVSVSVLSRGRFNALQIGLAVLTLAAAASLVFSGVRYGLLASPDMGVAGPGSGEGAFTWFVDRSRDALPRPTVYSAPMWLYRTLMFAWALWIAVGLARWLRFAWRAWSAQGYWRAPPARPAAPASTGPAPPAPTSA